MIYSNSKILIILKSINNYLNNYNRTIDVSYMLSDHSNLEQILQDNDIDSYIKIYVNSTNSSSTMWIYLIHFLYLLLYLLILEDIRFNATHQLGHSLLLYYIFDFLLFESDPYKFIKAHDISLKDFMSK